MSVSDMAETLKSMPKQEEMVKNYKVHIDLLKKVTTAASERRLAKLVELEQTIISGKEKTAKANNTSIVKAVSQISKELEARDYLRLLMIYFSCFEMAPKDKETMLKSVTKETARDAIQNLKYLNPSLENESKFRRKHPEMTDSEMNAYLEAHSRAKLDILKCEPQIHKLCSEIISGRLDAERFPFMGERPSSKRAKEEESKGLSDMKNKPKVFVFVAGGLSHHEIVSLERLQASSNTRIVPGSD